MIRWLLAGVVVFGVSVVWHLPASWVVGHLALPEGLALQSVGGNWRQGQAQVLWQGRDMGRVRWHLQGWRLLLGTPSAQVAWHRGSARLSGELTVSATGLAWSGVSGVLPVRELAGMLPETAGAGLALAEGRVQVAALAGRFGWRKRWVEAVTGRGVWYEASLMGVALPDVDWSLDQKGMPVQLTAQGRASWGKLLASGSLAPGRWQVRLEVVAEDGKRPPAGLTGWLRQAGPGRWQSAFQGAW